jgi:hypothetical protein
MHESSPIPAPRQVLDKEDLGVIAVQLALYLPQWVRRRRFIIDYVDDTTIHQRMSVDFVLPEADWFWSPTRLEPGTKIYVPLTIALKDTLDQFTAYDEGGRRLSMLPTADNGALAVAGLLPIVRGAAGRLADLATLERHLGDIVFARKTPDHDPIEEVLQPKLDGELRAILPVQDEVRSLLRDLARGFLMLVPVTYEPGVDRLLKAEWDFPNYWRGRPGDHCGVAERRSVRPPLGPRRGGPRASPRLQQTARDDQRVPPPAVRFVRDRSGRA